MIADMTLTLADSGLGALGINAGAFISQLIIFLVVFIILWKFVFPIMLQTLDKRQQVIRKGIQDAEDAKEALSAATNRAEQVLIDARRQAQETIERAAKVAEQEGQRIEAEARARSAQFEQQQVARIQQEANRARAELSRLVVNLSIDAAGKVINRSVDNKDNRRMVEDFVAASDRTRDN